MGYGISETAEIMSRMIQKMDFVSSNLANASTSGYKAEHLYASGQEALTPQQKQEGTLPPIMAAIDFSRGMIQQTGNVLDLMVESDGFFAVQGKEGTVYTRKGDFTINRDGILVTQTGESVLNDSGMPITVKGKHISIGRDGAVKVDDSEVGKLRVVSFADPGTLRRGENGYYSSTVEPRKTDNPEVVQGSLELSNVNVIREMIDMIDINRSFEVYQKIIQSMSEEDKISVNRIGRLG